MLISIHSDTTHEGVMSNCFGIPPHHSHTAKINEPVETTNMISKDENK